jgi:hypothetical protein
MDAGKYFSGGDKIILFYLNRYLSGLFRQSLSKAGKKLSATIGADRPAVFQGDKSMLKGLMNRPAAGYFFKPGIA